jgi:hypothetical protein
MFPFHRLVATEKSFTIELSAGETCEQIHD